MCDLCGHMCDLCGHMQVHMGLEMMTVTLRLRLVIQRLNIPFQLLIDGLDFVGILLLQLNALLIGGFLNLLQGALTRS